MREDLEKSINSCLEELKCAYAGKYDSDRAEKTAALCLEVQMRLSTELADAEFRAKMSKTEVERTEADKYFDYKNTISDKKITEAGLAHSVAKDEQVLNAKSKAYKEEAEFKKWNYMFNSLKEAHVYFRGMAKKTWE